MSTRARKTLIILLIIVVTLSAVIAFFDWNLLKGFISRQVSEKTGREFSIGGDLDVDLSFKPRIRAEKIIFGNAAWGTEPRMAEIDVVDFRIDLLKLIGGDTVFPSIILSRPKVVLEKNKEGLANWKFMPESDEPPPLIERLIVDQGSLVYRDPTLDTDIKIDVSMAPKRPEDPEQMMDVAGNGRFKDMKFSASGRGASALTLRDRTTPYPFDIQATAGSTRATAKGTLTHPLQLQGMNVDLTLAGSDLSKLYDIIKVALPSTPPYQLSGHLIRNSGDTNWNFSNFKGRVGDSDLSGDVLIDTGPKKKFFKASLVSNKLDFDDLAGFVGAPPKTGPGETASAEQKRQAAQLATKTKVLPDTPFKLDKLNVMNADVKFRGKRIIGTKMPIDDLDTHLVLKDGRLSLRPINFGVAGGDIRGNVVLNAQRSPIQTQADLTVAHIDLKKLVENFQIPKGSAGTIGGRIKLDMTGNSVAKMLGSADGTVGVGMAGGSISNLLVELAGIDVAEAIKFLLGKDKIIPIRCAVADFNVKQGVMDTRILVFDTTDTNIPGSGTINLRDEILDLTLKPQPKDRSFVSAKAPIYITGPFKKPKVRPDVGVIATKGGLAVALGAIAAPIAALIPLFEKGEGKDSNCGALLATLSADTGAKIPNAPPGVKAKDAQSYTAPRAAAPGSEKDPHVAPRAAGK